MVTKPVHPELLDKLPTLKKAIENERIRTEELEKVKKELEKVKKELEKVEKEKARLEQLLKENARLKQILKENNIEVD